MRNICTIPGCGRVVNAHGLCGTHYARLKVYGDVRAADPIGRHGLSRTPEYRNWRYMRVRCLLTTTRKYPDYGGRGITICPEWDDFQTFLRDMGPRPTAAHSLGRIDNDGDYTPTNCRWETQTQQARNRRSSRLITIDGETLSLAAWCERYGAEYARTRHRLLRGRDVLEALTSPPRYGDQRRCKA